MNKMMRSLGKSLYLKKHECGFDSKPVFLYSPTDIEGHKGYDNRFYIGLYFSIFAVLIKNLVGRRIIKFDLI